MEENVSCVIWTRLKKIVGIRETLLKLKEIGKQVHFVSNNCTNGLENFINRFEELQLEVHQEDLAYPTQAMIAYLKEIKYNKEKQLFILGSNYMKEEFNKEGYTVINSAPVKMSESTEAIAKILKDDENVGAVLFDHDMNLNYIKLLKAMVYLNRPEVLYITGASDKTFPVGMNTLLIGPGKFQNILEDITGRIPIMFGKPALNFNKFIVEKFNIQNSSRTLFIGDSLEQDMEFASKCGYQKLLVLTGVTNLNQAKSCVEQSKVPDFYINSLGDLHDILNNTL